MTLSSNTENGVSSWGGRLVSPIIGRFWGYLTSGRSPFSKGRVMVSAAKLLADDAPNAPVVSNAEAPRKTLRLVIMAFSLLGRDIFPLPAKSKRTSRPLISANSQIGQPVPTSAVLCAAIAIAARTVQRDAGRATLRTWRSGR